MSAHCLARRLFAGVFTSLVLLLAFAGPSPQPSGAQGSITITVDPAAPVEGDFISVTVAGLLPTPCFDVSSSHAILGPLIIVEVRAQPQPGACIQVISPFSVTERLGRLLPGDYNVEAIVYIPSWCDTGCGASAAFHVQSRAVCSSAPVVCMTVDPRAPVEGDEIKVRVTGELPDSCWVVRSSHTVSGNAIGVLVEAVPSPWARPCILIITPFSVTENIGKLAVGSYDVHALVKIPDCPPDGCKLSTSLNVQPDSDADRFGDALESFITTDPEDPCADTAAQNDERGPAFGEPLSPFGPDLDDDQRTALSDVLLYVPVFGASAGGAAYSPRFDLNADSRIGLSDVLSIAPFFGQACSP